MLSPEIQVFIQAIKSELMGVESPEIESVDFEVLQKKIWFHSIRPVLHQFFKTHYTDLSIRNILYDIIVYLS